MSGREMAFHEITLTREYTGVGKDSIFPSPGNPEEGYGLLRSQLHQKTFLDR